MEKGRYKYFPVIQNPEKAVFKRAFVYINQREWTTPEGLYRPPVCLSISPNGNQMYVVDMKGDYAKEKMAVLQNQVERGVYPIIGPFDSVEEAAIAERKARPATVDEKLAQADAVMRENEILRREIAEAKKK